MKVFIDQFQEQIWKDKYQYNNETFEGFCHRISDNIFSSEEELKYREELYNALISFEVLFGGRINSNIGIKEDGLTLFNCFIEPAVNDPDSLRGIMEMAHNYVMTLKTEGGVGFCADFFRPARTLIKKIGVTTPGSIKFLELFDKLSEVITSGSVDKTSSYQGVPTKNSIRKGATMVTMSICHPDIEDFITAKSIPNKLTKMNMSVLVTDDFIEASKNDGDWDLWFPDINFEDYESKWRGDFKGWKQKGYPIVVYKTVKAKYLWDLLLKNSYNRSEPGVLFIDNARKMDNLWYLPDSTMNSCNPCVIGSTRLHTKAGMVRVSDVCEDGIDNKVVVDNRTTSDKSLGVSILNASQVIKTGENVDVYKITTKAGYEVTATSYHTFFTNKGKKELKDLNIGDKFFIQSGEGGFGSFGDVHLGRIVGVLVGDGVIYSGWSRRHNISTNKITLNVCGKNKVLGKYFINKINDLVYNGEDCEQDYIDSIYYDKKFDKIGIESTILYDILADNGLVNNIKCRVPDCIFNASRECVIGYLQGLFQSNGSMEYGIKNNITIIKLGNDSIELLKDVQVLLSNFGIFSKISKNYNVQLSPDDNGALSYYKRKEIYVLVIDGISVDIFMEGIGFIIDYKNNIYKKDVCGEVLAVGEQFEDSIASIEYAGKEDVYCLTQPEYNSVIFNGVVTGNCSEVLSNVGLVTHNNEQVLVGDVCDLGSINIVKFYDVKTQQFDINRFNACAKLMVRALDNVSDISGYPLPIYEKAAKLKRKVGVGITGIGSLAMMMNMRYGSDEHIEFLEHIGHQFINTLYQASALLAEEKGPFALYSKELMQGGYVKNGGTLTEETVSLIRQHGLRNAALACYAPNGTLSILAGNVSGGLEPVFSKEFTRWNRVEGKKPPFSYPDVHKGEWFETDYFKEKKVGDEIVLFSTDGDYRVDRNHGLCKKIIIKDYGYNIAKELGYENTAGAMELSVEEHLRVLSTLVRYVDQSASKTINLPSSIDFEEFASLYGDIHKYGIKGCTTYREGSSVAVLETVKSENKKSIKKQQSEFLDAFKEHSNKKVFQNVKLPEEYPAKGYILRSDGGKKWYLHVAFKDKALKKPFALFVNTNNSEADILTFTALDKLADLSKAEGLNGGLLDEVKRKYAYQKNPVKICRMIGFLLRHNVDIINIVKVLDTVDEATVGTFVFRIKKFLATFVEEINDATVCPNCGEKSLVFREGCHICLQCLASRC